MSIILEKKTKIRDKTFKKEKFKRNYEVEPILVYEDVMYGQKVIVKRYPSSVPIIDIYTRDDFLIVSKDMDLFYPK